MFLNYYGPKKKKQIQADSAVLFERISPSSCDEKREGNSKHRACTLHSAAGKACGRSISLKIRLNEPKNGTFSSFV